MHIEDKSSPPLISRADLSTRANNDVAGKDEPVAAFILLARQWSAFAFAFHDDDIEGISVAGRTIVCILWDFPILKIIHWKPEDGWQAVAYPPL